MYLLKNITFYYILHVFFYKKNRFNVVQLQSLKTHNQSGWTPHQSPVSKNDIYFLGKNDNSMWCWSERQKLNSNMRTWADINASILLF